MIKTHKKLHSIPVDSNERNDFYDRVSTIDLLRQIEERFKYLSDTYNLMKKLSNKEKGTTALWK